MSSADGRATFDPTRVRLQGPATLSELWQWWLEDWRAHDRDSSRAGFRAIAVHRFGNYRMHWPRPWRFGLSLLYRWLFRYVRNHYGIEVPYSAQIGRRVVIEHQGAIVIHGSSVIGDDCILRQGVTLGNRHLNAPFDAPILGRHVNVGAGAKILGRVLIGDNACVGANAVVLCDVPADATAVGIPAKLVLGQNKA
jgi:serine O-acetyltransferase